MRKVADMVIAATAPGSYLLPAGSALVEMGKVLPQWYPAFFLGELQPFQQLRRHGSIKTEYKISFGRVVDAPTSAGWQATPPRAQDQR